MTAIPKRPADRNPRLLELARGEDCAVRAPGGACDPATTVWAHSNALAANKGKGYKSSDSAGVLACYRCHAMIDQPGPSDPGPQERERLWDRAYEATTDRLRVIAQTLTMKPWKVAAARWALERRAK